MDTFCSISTEISPKFDIKKKVISRIYLCFQTCSYSRLMFNNNKASSILIFGVLWRKNASIVFLLITFQKSRPQEFHVVSYFSPDPYNQHTQRLTFSVPQTLLFVEVVSFPGLSGPFKKNFFYKFSLSCCQGSPHVIVVVVWCSVLASSTSEAQNKRSPSEFCFSLNLIRSRAEFSRRFLFTLSDLLWSDVHLQQ